MSESVTLAEYEQVMNQMLDMKMQRFEALDNVNKLKKEIGVQKQHIANIESSKHKSDVKLKNVLDQLARVNAQKGNMDINPFKDEIVSLKRQIEIFKNAGDSSVLVSLQADNERIIAALGQANSKVLQLSEEREQLHITAKNATRKANDIEENFIALRKAHGDVLNSRQELEKQVSMLSAKIASNESLVNMEKKLQECNDELDLVRHQLKDASSAVTLSDSALVDKQAENEMLQLRIHELESGLKQLRGELRNERTEREHDHSVQLAELQNKLELALKEKQETAKELDLCSRKNGDLEKMLSTALDRTKVVKDSLSNIETVHAKEIADLKLQSGILLKKSNNLVKDLQSELRKNSNRIVDLESQFKECRTEFDIYKESHKMRVLSNALPPVSATVDLSDQQTPVEQEVTLALAERFASTQDQLFTTTQCANYLEESVRLLNQDLQTKRSTIHALISLLAPPQRDNFRPLNLSGFGTAEQQRDLFVKMELLVQDVTLQNAMLKQSLSDCNENLQNARDEAELQQQACEDAVRALKTVEKQMKTESRSEYTSTLVTGKTKTNWEEAAQAALAAADAALETEE